jgi:hypothetical protein
VLDFANTPPPSFSAVAVVDHLLPGQHIGALEADLVITGTTQSTVLDSPPGWGGVRPNVSSCRGRRATARAVFTIMNSSGIAMPLRINWTCTFRLQRSLHVERDVCHVVEAVARLLRLTE